MADVSFNEDPQDARRAPTQSRKPGSIISLMYRLGLAKTEKDANVVLGGVIVVCLIVSATMFVFVQPHPESAQQTALKHDVERMQEQLNAHPSKK